jgi:hypothetical protein
MDNRNPTRSFSHPVAVPEVSLQDRLYTFADLAAHLEQQRPGSKVSTSTCWRWHKKGVEGADGQRWRLPAVRLGKTHVTTLACAAWFFARLAEVRAVELDFSRAADARRSRSRIEAVARRLGGPPSPRTSNLIEKSRASSPQQPRGRESLAIEHSKRSAASADPDDRSQESHD